MLQYQIQLVFIFRNYQFRGLVFQSFPGLLIQSVKKRHEDYVSNTILLEKNGFDI